MSETKTYNGWTNYETWNVALWIDNDQGSYGYWRERAREAATSAKDAGDSLDDAKTALADWLADEIQANNPLADQCSLYSDILSANLSDVNWYEIASNWIDEIADEEQEEDEDESGDE